MKAVQNNQRVGVWLIGARGAIATCVTYGIAGLREGILEATGMVTERAPFDVLELSPLDALVLGGHDVCARSISQSAGELVRSGVLTADLVAACSSQAAEYEARLRPGLLDGPDVGLADLDPRSATLGAAAPLEQIAQLTADWDEFERTHELNSTVVVYIASTEASRVPQAEWDDLDQLRSALDAGTSQPASIVYAYAALNSGRPFVNFTPSLGASIPALRALAEETKTPHCGADGKTGETLLKTSLAPMFHARALRVLSWQGYNMLGNRDGEVLRDESHREAKLRNKDDVLHSLLSDQPDLHSKVGIDFVPSLGDWKTAWDFIHFEGFLGAKMTLQFTWAGSDSALAAPLVIDLARLAEFAQRQGEFGTLAHTACFFKNPIDGGTHDFHQQYARLLDYVATHAR